MEKNAKNVPFFHKERKRMQKTFCSFIKNGKERKNVALFWKERMPNSENGPLQYALVTNIYKNGPQQFALVTNIYKYGPLQYTIVTNQQERGEEGER